MNATLRVETLRLLRKFWRRRTAMLCVRGLCAFLAVAILLLILVALIDRSSLIADSLRWTGSCVAYGIALLTGWWLGVRLLTGPSNQRQLATMIEAADPSLREQFLSAVELGDPKSLAEAGNDSLDFRSRVQDDAAAKADSLDVRRIFPFQRIRRSAVGLLGVALLLVGLCFIPGLRFGEFFQRAALPFANLARPADIEIDIVQPQPADCKIAADDTVKIMAEISGRRTDSVYIEVQNPGAETKTLEMRRERMNVFSTEVEVGQHDLNYRLRAEDALTRYHKITSLPRPRVLSFTKTFLFPEYTRRTSETTTEANGNLKALNGTVVQLEMNVDQPIEKAELELESLEAGVPSKILPLTVSDDGSTLSGDVVVSKRFESYRVHVVSSEHGITNKFDPRYEIVSVADQAPVITMNRPDETTEAFLDGSLLIAGRGEDDYGITQVNRVWRINGGDWEQEPLDFDGIAPKDGLQRVRTQTKWKLSSSDFAAEDIVLLKLRATDAVGNTAETEVVRLFIREPEKHNPQKQWAKKKGEVARELTDLQQQMTQARDAVAQAEDAIKKKPEDRDGMDQLKLAKAEDLLMQADQMAKETRDSLKRAMKLAPSRSEEKEIQAAARILSEAQHEHLKQAVEDAKQLAKNELVPQRENHRNIRHQTERAMGTVSHVARLMQTIAAEAEAKVLKEDAKRLAKTQERVAKESEQVAKAKHPDQQKKDRLVDQGTFNRKKTVQLKTSVEELMEIAGAQRGKAQQIINHVNQAENRMQQSRDRHQRDQERKQKANVDPVEMEQAKNRERAEIEKVAHQGLQQAERQTENLAQSLARDANKAREELLKNMDGTPELHQAQHQTNRINDKMWQSTQRELNEGDKKQLAEARQQLKEDLDSAVEQIRDNREMEALRKHADEKAATDQSMLASALEELKQQNPIEFEASKQLSEELKKIDQIRKALESDAQVRDLSDAVRELAKNESGIETSDSNETAKQQARDWTPLKKQLDQLPESLKQAAVEKTELSRAKKSLVNESRKVDKEMRQRLKESQKRKSLAKPLDQIAETVEKHRGAIEEKAEAARKELAKMVPQIPSQPQHSDLAKESRQALGQSQTNPGKEPSSKGSEAAEKSLASNQPTGQPAKDTGMGDEEDQAMSKAYTIDVIVESDPTDWGKLPTKMADEILQSRRENVSPEYRSAIESYYKALSEKSKADKK